LRAGGLSTDGTFSQGQNVNFRGANLAGARLSGTLASSADFSDAIMSKVNLTGADLRGSKFEGADLTEAEIKGAQLFGANLKSTILTGVGISDISGSGADLTGAVTDDNVGKPVSALGEPLAKLIKDHRNWVATVGKQGSQLDLSGYDMRTLLSLSGERLTALKSIGGRYCGMDLTDIQMQSSVLDRSDFRSCFMRGADFRASSMREVKLGHADLRNADFRPLVFDAGNGAKRNMPCDLEGANLRYADCSGARFSHVSFRNADLCYANLTGCDLSHADFTGARLEGALLEGAGAAGAILDDKAPSILRSLSESAPR
jgi:uncharacterized protein YjbI with pentapeptide repeats